MATYEELFPDQPVEPFAPIQTGRVAPELREARSRARAAIDLTGAGVEPDSGFGDAFGDLMLQPPSAPQVGGETEWADYGRAAVAGVGDLGQAAAGAGEYLANRVAGARDTPFEQGFGDLADQFAGGRRGAAEFAQSWYDSMTPEARGRAEREVFTLDPNQTIWQGSPGEFLSSVGLKMARSAPSTGVTLLPGALIMRAGLGRGALAYLGASEGGLSLGSIAANIAQEVEQADEAELMQSPRYQQLRQQYDEPQARQQLAQEAQGYVPVIGGLVVGAISAAAGRYLEPIFVDKIGGGVASRFGRGFVSEAAQESGQSGAEQIAQNVAAKVFDDRGTFEGVPEAIGQGALVGGAMGGTTLAAVGPRPQPQTAIPTGEVTPTPPAGSSPTAAAPETFDQVFGKQTPPPGGWRGGDIETGLLPDIDSTGQRLLQVGPVDPAAQAALNARADNRIQDMFERQGPTPQQEQAAYIQRPWPVQQTVMDLPQAQTGVVPSGPPTQLPLGVRERVRGGPPQVIEPTPAAPLVEDTSAPAGFSQERLPTLAPGQRPTRADFMRQRAAQQYAGTVTDPRQRDMFAEQPLPGAAPITGGGPRTPEGFVVVATDEQGNEINRDIFSSAEEANTAAEQWAQELPDALINVGRSYSQPARLSSQPLTPDTPSAEPLSDLNAQLADLADPDSPRLGVYLSLANMQQVGDVPSVGVPLADFDGKGGVLIAKNRATAEELLAMREEGIELQAILGYATGAGSGKPAGANIAVQQRDEQGNVVRESLVATPEEADVLASEFDQPGREGVVLSAGMAIKRRAQRIAAEQQRSSQQKAAKTIGRRVEEAGGESDEQRRAIALDKLQRDLAASELQESYAPTRAGRIKARERAKELRGDIERMRSAAEATVKERVPPKPEVFSDTRKALETMTDEEINKLPGEKVESLFREAANVASGSRVTRTATRDQTREVAEADATTTFSPHGKTLEEIIAAHPSRSEKLKLIGRVKRMIRVRAMGGKTKTKPITGKAGVRKGVAGTDNVAVRKSELHPTKALELEPPREMSAAARAKHNARVRTTYSQLGKRMQAFATKGQQLNEQLFRQSQEREADGNPPHTARDAIYGRAYLNTLLRYGQMLQALRPRSTAGLKEVERYNALIEDLLDSKPDKFLSKLARATEAESGEQANAAIRMDPTVLKNMGTRRLRVAHALESAANIREKIARTKRLHDVWHANAKYEAHVAPLIQKIIGYVTHDTSLAGVASERRGLGYVPTFSEMRNLRATLKSFKTEDREQLYKPLKRWFEDYGFKFDNNGDLVLAKNAAQFDFVQPSKVLENDRSAFRNAPLNYNQKVAAEKARKHKLMLDTERARRRALTPAQRRREDLTLANRIERERRKGMSYEQRRALESLDRRGLNLELVGTGAYDTPVLRAAGAKVADLLEREPIASLNDVLNELGAALPEGHAFHPLIQKLISLNMSNAYVGWDRTGKLMNPDAVGNLSVAGGRRIIKLNRLGLEAMREAGNDPAPTFIHAILHESVHAATAGAIDRNANVRLAMRAIMVQTRQQLASPARGFDPDTTYGLRDMDVKEFVAEAFSNPSFQAVLRSVEFDKSRSIWDAIVDLVKRILGLPQDAQATNALEAVMITADQLFTGEMPGTRGKESLDLKDPTMEGTISNTIDKVIQSSRVTKGIRDRAKNVLEANREGGNRFLLSALTMEQIRDFYANNFGGGRGPLSEYMKAFFQRNADNSANMEEADKLSRRWTTLTEEHGAEEAVKLSRLMTEATLYGIHPDESLQSQANAHVTSMSQKSRHADLSKQYRELKPDFRKLYHDVGEFYDQSLRKEVNLMTLNALRGAVEGDFNYSEADVLRKKLNTVTGMEKEFGDRLGSEARKVIARMASLPDMRIGPYFPLMRFGDYVVTAERTKERKHFTDRKDATAWAQTQREEDPTLSVSSPIEDDDGFSVSVKEKEVRLAETPSEAEQDRQDMIAEYGSDNVSRVQLKAQLYSRGSTIESGSGLKAILGKLDGNPAAQQAIKDFYLRSLSDGAFRKREIKRANRRGVDYDTQHRTFASYAKSAAYYTSQLRYGWSMADSLIDMQKYVEETAKGEHDADLSPVRMGEVVREIDTRDKLTHDRIEVSKLVRGGTELSQFMMLTSPSYWMINATQPYMVTLPWLAARSSIGEATAALTTAQKLIISPIVNQMGESFGGLKALWSKAGAEKAFTVLEQVEEHIKQRGGARADEYISMLSKLKRDSIIDLSFVAELRDIAEGQNTSMTQRVLDASRIMSHLTEVNNRIMTAIAAYDLYRTKGMSAFEAQEFAKQAVSLTQFNYSSGNAPRLFQARGPLGQMGPLVFQFMKYPQHMYALLIDNFRRAVYSGGMDREIALKTLAGLFSTHLAAGGVIGAMLQPIKWAIGLAMAAFGDDDEPYTVKNAMSGETFDRLIRNAAADLFGNEFGEIVAAGAPRAAGIDLSNRMSLGSLYFIDMKTDTAESTLGSLLSSFGGPLVSLGTGWWKGAQYIADGQVSKGLEAFMPKAAKDAAKAIRYSNEGLTDATGKEIIGADKLSPWQLFAQSIGFQPAQVSEAYARRAAIKDAQGYDADRRAQLLRRFQNASVDERAGIIGEIAEFNRGNPMAGISRSQLLKSVQSFKERSVRTSSLGVDLQGDDILYEEEGSAYE